MNKTEFIARLAEETDITKVDAKNELEDILNTIVKVLSEGEDVALTGFGKFTINRVEERNGRNPATGEAMVIPAHNKIAFSFASNIKKELK